MMQFALDLNTPEGRTCARHEAHPGRKAEPARARRDDPATSQRAAAKVERFASGHFLAILCALDRMREGTYKEVADVAGLERHACARRLPELERAGKVTRTENERDGCTIWRLA